MWRTARFVLSWWPRFVLMPHTYVSSLLLCMCPHPTKYVSSPYLTIHVSSYFYVCVLILLCMCLILLYMCPHTTMYASSYYYICVLILLYMPAVSYIKSWCVCVCVLERERERSRTFVPSSYPHTTIYVRIILLLHVCRRCSSLPSASSSVPQNVLETVDGVARCTCSLADGMRALHPCSLRTHASAASV